MQEEEEEEDEEVQSSRRSFFIASRAARLRQCQHQYPRGLVQEPAPPPAAFRVVGYCCAAGRVALNRVAPLPCVLLRFALLCFALLPENPKTATLALLIYHSSYSSVLFFPLEAFLFFFPIHSVSSVVFSFIFSVRLLRSSSRA